MADARKPPGQTYHSSATASVDSWAEPASLGSPVPHAPRAMVATADPAEMEASAITNPLGLKDTTATANTTGMVTTARSGLDVPSIAL